MLEITVKGDKNKIFYNSNDLFSYIDNLKTNHLKYNIMENIILVVKEPEINDIFEYQIIILWILEKNGYKIYNLSNDEMLTNVINTKLEWSYYVLTQNKKMTVRKLIDVVKRTNPLIMIPQTESKKVHYYYNQ